MRKDLHASEIKKRGKKIKLTKNWEEIKYDHMRRCVESKFTINSKLQDLLKETHPHELIEGNWWGDKTWGVCLKSNEGENHLGKILMEFRQELIEKELK